MCYKQNTVLNLFKNKAIHNQTFSKSVCKQKTVLVHVQSCANAVHCLHPVTMWYILVVVQDYFNIYLKGRASYPLFTKLIATSVLTPPSVLRL